MFEINHGTNKERGGREEEEARKISSEFNKLHTALFDENKTL